MRERRSRSQDSARRGERVRGGGVCGGAVRCMYDSGSFLRMRTASQSKRSTRSVRGTSLSTVRGSDRGGNKFRRNQAVGRPRQGPTKQRIQGAVFTRVHYCIVFVRQTLRRASFGDRDAKEEHAPAARPKGCRSGRPRLRPRRPRRCPHRRQSRQHCDEATLSRLRRREKARDEGVWVRRSSRPSGDRTTWAPASTGYASVEVSASSAVAAAPGTSSGSSSMRPRMSPPRAASPLATRTPSFDAPSNVGSENAS